jgi:CRP-like cAMP-binding protein
MEDINKLKKAINILAGQEVEDLGELETIFSIKICDKNEFFLKQNESPLYVGFILSGIMREFYIDNKGREYNKVFCFNGDFTGSYYDLSSGRPSLVSIQALTNCRILVSKFHEVKRLIDTDAKWLKLAYLLVHNLLIKKFEKEQQIYTLSATERYRLLRKNHPEFEQLIPAFHIASYLGITPISLSRIRANLTR